MPGTESSVGYARHWGLPEVQKKQMRPHETTFIGGALLLVLMQTLGCSSDGPSNGTGGTGGQAAGSGKGGNSASTGGASSSKDIVGTFAITLNPAIDVTGPYTSIFGTVYTGEYPSDVVETPVSASDSCTVYRFSRHNCTSPACTTTQACVDTNVCRDFPTVVSVGEVTVNGIGSAPLTLAAINNNYQNGAEISYPGFGDGTSITLNAAGSHYPAFSVSAKGVAPAALRKDSYLLSPGTALSLEWEPGSAAVAANVSLLLNISKHGGSAGYLKCELDDSGSFTIPGEQIQALIDLGVAGFPQLTFTRSTRGEAQVSTGLVALEVNALAVPTLAVEGYCSCNDSSDCGSCSDKTKTVCDSNKRLCHAP
jgi:hypothetical protein